MLRITNRTFIAFLLCVCCLQAQAQSQKWRNRAQRADSILSEHYNRSNIDTNYVVRPKTKWTLRLRGNISGAGIQVKGVKDGVDMKGQMKADNKKTLSVGVSYQGLSVAMALNPSKIFGRYHDFELNGNLYGRKWGFDIIYQHAHNMTGWIEEGSLPRRNLPDDMMKIRTLNLNGFYVFNSKRFSYPAAFTQSYIQKRSAGSFFLSASAQGQDGDVNTTNYNVHFRMYNIALGGGYGYNFVPGRHWLLHISAMPTFVVLSNTWFRSNDLKIDMRYSFPDVIVTGRAAVVKGFGNKFAGFSCVYTITSVGARHHLEVTNVKWRIRAFVGMRL